MANNAIEKIDIDGRTWRTTTKLPRVTDFGTVICENGKPVPGFPTSKLLNQDELKYWEKLKPGYTRSYSCYMDCVKQHEQSHANDALAENPSICAGVPNGKKVLVYNDNPTDLYKSELNAHVISRKCLQDCNKNCPGYHVDEGLKIEKEWEDKNVFE